MFILVDILEAFRYKSPLRKQGKRCEKLMAKFRNAPSGKRKGKALDKYNQAVKHMRALKAKYVGYEAPRSRDYYQQKDSKVYDYKAQEVSPVTFKRLP